MGQNVEINFSAKEADAVRAWLSIQRAADGYTGSVGRLDAAQTKAARSAQEHDTALAKGQQFMKGIETAQEKANRKLAEAADLYRRGGLTAQQYEHAVKQLNGTQQASGGILDSVFGKITAAGVAYGAVTTAVGGIKIALQAVMESNRQFIEDAEKAAATYDKIFRQFRIQADLRGVAGEQAKNRILGIAEKTGFTEERATSAATALVSAGVTADEASGGALEGFLNTLNAQGLRDSDPQQFAESIAQYLNSQGMTVNTENMKMIGVQLQSLKDTKVKLTDLPQLAQIGAGLKGKLTEQEQMATFATLGDTLGANIASTRMADIFNNLAIAGGKADAVKYLDSMGMKPEDIDFKGENFATVMDRLDKGLAKLSPEQQDIALAKIIEGGNVKDFRLLQDKLPQIMQRAGNLNDVATYEADVREGSSGIDPAKNRQELRRNRLLADRDTQTDLLRGEVLQNQLDQGRSPLMQWTAKSAFDLTRFTGAGGLVGADDDALAASAASMATNPQFVNFLAGFGKEAARAIVPSIGAPFIPSGAGQVLGSSLAIGQTAGSDATAAREAVERRMGASNVQSDPQMDRVELRQQILEPIPQPDAQRFNLLPIGPYIQRDEPPSRAESKTEASAVGSYRPAVERRAVPSPDPQMEEQNRLLQEQVRLTGEVVQAVKNGGGAPRTDTRPNTTPAAPVRSAERATADRP